MPIDIRKKPQQMLDRSVMLTSCTDTQVLLLPQPMGTHKGHPYGLIV
ncbi:MAG: hypothetical protein LH613_02375 [Chamaesiphon sp.]|nr:hypothetical protein [Chamaesiphon sp.]